MIVDIHGLGFTVTPALAARARRRLHDVLIHRSDVIQRIVIRLGGADGLGSHNDMYCLMQIRMSDALVATVMDIGPHIHDLIDRSTDRVGRLVAACLNQASSRRRAASSANSTLRRHGDALAGAERRGQEIRQHLSTNKPQRPALSWNMPPSLS